MRSDEFHNPVLVREVLNVLHINKNSKVIDATLGLAGHTIEFVKKGASVLGIEADEESLNLAEKKLMLACPGEYVSVLTSIKLIKGNFRDIDVIAKGNNFTDVDGILADLGVSTYQLTSDDRGLSFQTPQTFLDMRIDREGNEVTAADLLNLLRIDQLKEMFMTTLSFSEADKVTRNIDIQRNLGKKFKTVSDLLKVLPKTKIGKLNPATLAFLALRMAVNSEIPNLIEFLPKALSLLKPGGTLAVISFHSGEDRVVKNNFREMELQARGKVLSGTPIVPTPDEIYKNPRSRSAKMRVLIKN